jgi:hypothetical protein
MPTTPNWIYKRVAAMNRILKKYNNKPMHEHFIDEHWRLMNTKCKNKKEYKIWTQANGKV